MVFIPAMLCVLDEYKGYLKHSINRLGKFCQGILETDERESMAYLNALIFSLIANFWSPKPSLSELTIYFSLLLPVKVLFKIRFCKNLSLIQFVERTGYRKIKKKTTVRFSFYDIKIRRWKRYYFLWKTSSLSSIYGNEIVDKLAQRTACRPLLNVCMQRKELLRKLYSTPGKMWRNEQFSFFWTGIR